MALKKSSKPAAGRKRGKKEVHYREYYAEKAAALPPLRILIFACILVFAVGGMGAGVFFILQGPKAALEAPEGIEVVFNQELDFWVQVSWNESVLAENYRIDYIYELYPDAVKSVTIADTSYKIERKRGMLNFRVSARDKAGRLAPSEWIRLDIEPFYLDVPRVSCLLQNESLNISWTDVSYAYFNNYKQVRLYEYIEEFYYFDDGEYVLENINRNTKITNLKHFIIEADSLDKFYHDGYAKIVFKVRALNYTRTLAGSYQNLPEELYDIYNINSSWGYAEYTL